jgi:drug/metabolite transporter (DMT)-like permease
MAFTALSLIWSSTWVVLKAGLWSLPPFLAAGIRFSLAFIILLVIARIKKIELARDFRSHAFFLLFGFLNFTGGYAFVYWGQQYIPSGLGSVLFSVMPFYVIIFSYWILPMEIISPRKILGVVIGFIGVIIIFSDQLEISQLDSRTLWGMIAVVTAPVFTSLGNISGKKARQSYHAIALITYPMLYASISLYILSVLFEMDTQPVWDFMAIFSLIYLAVLGTAVAFGLYFWMLKNSSVVLMSMITFITPPLALIWGWVILAESITSFLVIGLICILAGIFIVRK